VSTIFTGEHWAEVRKLIKQVDRRHPSLLDPGPTLRKSAELSQCRTHRFSLSRVWDDSLPAFIVIGLNPSTADETEDDPTIRRCIAFAKREGCGSLIMLNLFSFRATDPKELKQYNGISLSDDGRNYRLAKEIVSREFAKGAIIVCAWGVGGALYDTGHYFRMLLGKYPLKCLGHTKEGHPRHPLYIKADQPLEPWTPWRFE
jgi:hypothetical protein